MTILIETNYLTGKRRAVITCDCSGCLAKLSTEPYTDVAQDNDRMVDVGDIAESAGWVAYCPLRDYCPTCPPDVNAGKSETITRYTNQLEDGDRFVGGIFDGRVFKRRVKFYDVNQFTIEFEDGEQAPNVHAVASWDVIRGGGIS